MLINCPECANQVSSLAAACPKCGAPPIPTIHASAPNSNHVVHSNAPTANSNSPVTIERTSKSIKGRQIIAALVFWLGVILWFSGIDAKDSGMTSAGGWMAIGGAVFWFYLRMARWWING